MAAAAEGNGAGVVPPAMSGPVIGIDLGTTNSAVAFVNEFGRPEILPNREGSRITPSVVLFDVDGPVVGEIARTQAILRPRDTAQFVKRHMGDREWKFRTSTGQELGAEEISAAILARLKSDAEVHLGCSVTRAVISVPAYFDDARRTATVDAATMAGLEVVRLLNEPTAAALAYGLDAHSAETVLVYDLGGGTFDVTIMKLADGSDGEFSVLATDGDTHLGGVDWDETLMGWLDKRFIEDGGPSLFGDAESEQILRETAVRVKHTLTQRDEANAFLSWRGCNAKIVVTRAIFDEITRPLLDRTVTCLERALADGGVGWSDLDRVVLVGGSSRMKQVIELIVELSGHSPQVQVNPDEAVALGAAVFAALATADENGGVVPLVDAAGRRVGDMSVHDITAHSMGIVVLLEDKVSYENSIIIPRGTPIPCTLARTYATTEDDQPLWQCRVTEGEVTDLAEVAIVGSGRIALPRGLPANTLAEIEMTYDGSAIIRLHVRFPDGTDIGELEIERRANLTGSEIRRGQEWLDTVGVE